MISFDFNVLGKILVFYAIAFKLKAKESIRFLPCGVFDGFDVVALDGPGFTSCGAFDSRSSISW